MKNPKQTTIVISGVNMTNSGLLSILHDCLFFLSKYTADKQIRIVALVPSKLTFDFPDVEFIAFPKSKKSWFFRMYYEFIHFRKLSRELNADIWFSLHDISPNVTAEKKFVYCHNPSPFFKPQAKDWRYGFKVSLFSLFYKFLYGLNIKSNTAVIVQQQWMKNAFEKMFGIRNVVTAAPNIHFMPFNGKPQKNSKIHFFYPAYPRTFKNFEIICQAVVRLPPQIRNKIKITLTLEQSDNAYADYIVNHYGTIPEIDFIGLISRDQVSDYYQLADALIFPSKLETWGLPLSEFRNYEKPIFASDLPYAHETLGGYDKAYFFNPENPEALAKLMSEFVLDNLPKAIIKPVIPVDFKTWNALFDYIFNGIRT